MKDKLFGLIRKSHLLLWAVFVSGLTIFSLTSSPKKNIPRRADTVLMYAVSSASDAISDEMCRYIFTTTTTTVTTTTTTTVSLSPYAVCAPTTYTGDSPNSSFYQDRLTIAGDSLALGLNVYGFIPDIHNIAGESVSIWNLDYFTFDVGGGEMGMIDAVSYVHPQLLYISIGMNDVNMNYPDSYVERYRQVLDEIIRRMPEINIVVAAITPVCSFCDVVRNDIIRDYNAALKKMVEDMDSEQVVFFDVYSVVCDEHLDLREEFSSGDGMHLYIPCYKEILNALFDFLDTTDFRERLGG
ncbi:SGNH/GDSL hydrolase family protein [uncultured Ruminococcus sp.]|uniref:SGNH/GDSL hydrolase family protein n=1 Tax=uncultured Ruminococcus sp. TaxID=165186 RepID=UPI00260AD5F2|nr:SGNH/GDSL hydrolase family protein [uncultured Ruminococcus sp.]